MDKYNLNQIAKELSKTALGESYYGSALYAVKDLPCLTDKERWMVSRWLNGSQCVCDSFDLQRLAIRLVADCQ